MDAEAANAVRWLKIRLEDQGFTPNKSGLFGNSLRQSRATQVLERSKSLDAIKALTILANSSNVSHATREAKQILAELKK